MTRLEKKLEIPEDERHTCAGELRKPTINTIKGVRVDLPTTAKSPSPAPKATRPSGKENNSKAVDTDKVERRLGVKSVWAGRDGDVSVEILALEWYEARGYRG